MEAAIRFWLEGNGVFDRPPAVREGTKGHGRRERRELWREESSELGASREAEYGWPDLTLCGVLRRRRCRLSRRSAPGAWAEQQLFWVAGGSVGRLSAQQAREGRRGHWEIENRLSWVREVRLSEDRLHG
jgi:hypothetical protein